MNQKTEKLQKKLLENWGYKKSCPYCEKTYYQSEIWYNRLIPWIKNCEQNNYKHPLKQIGSGKELLYIKCGSCGYSFDFSLGFFCERFL